MKVRLYADETIQLRLPEIVSNLNRLAPTCEFVQGQVKFTIPEMIVTSPSTYEKLNKRIGSESANDDIALLFTQKPYDNNFFWEWCDNKVIVSLYGWEYLTNLSPSNGAVYFICAIVIRHLHIGARHEKNTGCINDFWWDKTGVDTGMRSAFICQRCLDGFEEKANARQKLLLPEIQRTLNDLGSASRANVDICDFWKAKVSDEVFQVFMCHNSEEKDEIRQMNLALKGRGIRTWLDEEQLRPGCLWQELLEKQIEQIKTAAVFVGASGIGPWQNVEIRAFLSEFLRRGCPVIPVILSSCTSVPRLPLFLKQLTWVDFRKTTPDPLKQLHWGITGDRP